MNNAQIPPESRRKRSSLAMTMVLVACLAVMFWAWRRASESEITYRLSKAIEGGSSPDRIRAITDLWQVSANHARTATPALFSALDDPDIEVRSRAMASLRYLIHENAGAHDARKLRENLRIALKNPDPIVRVWSVELLGWLWDHTPEPVPTTGVLLGAPTDLLREDLTLATSDPAGAVRGTAFNALLRHTHSLPDRSRLLLLAASDTDPGVRAIAVWGMLNLPLLTREARLFVVRALNDPSPAVRKAAVRAYVPFSFAVPREVVPELQEIFRKYHPGEEDDLYIRWQTLAYLESLGPAASEVIPDLTRYLEQDAQLRHTDSYWVAQTLGAVAPGSAEARAWIPMLIKNLETSVGEANQTREPALRAMKTYLWAPDVVDAIQRVARDKHNKLAAEAAQTLINLQNSLETIPP